MTNAKERLKTGRIEMSIGCGNWKFTGDFRAAVQGQEGVGSGVCGLVGKKWEG